MQSDVIAARCEKLFKTYQMTTGEVHALRGVTAEFPAGTLFAVAGPSGSGKSSLLRLLAGIDRPTSGIVEVESVNVGAANARVLRRLRRDIVGYVFQRPSDNFFPYLTLRQHLDGDARRVRGSHAVDPESALDVLGIGGRADHLPSELSGGEQQRAAFARVLARGVETIVADEPTSQLDTSSAEGVLAAMRDLIELGVTIIVATHDAAVMRAADDRLELEHGLPKSRAQRAGEDPSKWQPPSADVWSSDPSKVWGPPRPLQSEPEMETTPERGSVPAGDTALGVRDLRKTYLRGDEVVHAVDGVTLTLNRRELVALVGRSGSGKTTLLDIVAGWERADGGSIDRRGASESPLWDELSMVPQKLGLMEELTVRENVEYPARLAGRLEELTPSIDRLVESLGLGHLQTRYPRETSVGEQQRTALARALVLTPRLLLADEPTGHQDRGWKEAVFQALRRAADDGTSCLVATHDEGVGTFVDRVLAMSDGRLVAGEDPG